MLGYTPPVQTSPLGRHPPWADTPHPPGIRLLLRTVRILLECILVFFYVYQHTLYNNTCKCIWHILVYLCWIFFSFCGWILQLMLFVMDIVLTNDQNSHNKTVNQPFWKKLKVLNLLLWKFKLSPTLLNPLIELHNYKKCNICCRHVQACFKRQQMFFILYSWTNLFTEFLLEMSSDLTE